MDPMTQSAQISSSQGLADGQNSAAKDSKFSDSFLSSSPVSLIQSPQDKRVVLGSDKPSEGVATSLRFPSQPGSFSPGNYGGEAGPPDGQPDSPIKTSPVSERIKALEALAAKKKEPDFRNDSGFPHFRERHYEKSPSEKTFSTQQKKKNNADQESPESPFEVLGEARQSSEFEDTADWMKAHLPPVPDFSDTVNLNKRTLASEESVSSNEVQEPDIVIPDVPADFAGIPEAFLDAPVESPKPTLDETPNKPSVDEESEFDLSFLPTAYVWEQQEKAGPQVPPAHDTVVPVSPAPPEGFDSPSPPLSPPAIDSKVDAQKTLWGGNLEPTDAAEVDSSGESDDTVIEDGALVPASSGTADLSDPTATPAPSNFPTEDIESLPPAKPPKKLMQVPTINVIETDEPNYSEEEMELEEEMDEDYEVVKDPVQEIPVSPEPEAEVTTAELPKARPLETEFMEGYSPPSSPVESDGEYSPKHKILESETNAKESDTNMDEQKPAVLKDLSSDIPQTQLEQSKATAIDFKDKASSFASVQLITSEEVNFPDYDDEWLDDAQDTAVKLDEADAISEGVVCDIPSKTNTMIDTDEKQIYIEKASFSKSTFMQDDLYDRQSFDDYSSSPALEEALNKNDVNLGHELSSRDDDDDDSRIHIESLSANTKQIDAEDEDLYPKPVGGQPSTREYPKDPYYSFQSAPASSMVEAVIDIKVNNDIIGVNVTKSKALPPEEINSKFQKDAKGSQHTPETTSDPERCSVSGATDSFVEFMRECLKSQKGNEPDDSHEGFAATNALPKSCMPTPQAPPTAVMDLEYEELTISALKELGSSQDEEEPPQPSAKVSGHNKADPHAAPLRSSCDSAPHFPLNSPPSDCTYSKEVEAIDVWVAEAYHLAEHVLTAILTHLSVKELIHWRDPKKSGVVFGLSLLLLLSLAAFSVISVASYLLLALLCVTISFRIYKSVVQAVQKSGDGHPFKALMDKDVSIPPETFRKHVDTSLTYINRALKQMSRLFLVEDLVDSLKLAVVMWLLTYVGAVFNGITILILADILLFAIPPIYEKNKTQVDQYIDLGRTQINAAIAKLQEKLPGAMKRAKTE